MSRNLPASSAQLATHTTMTKITTTALVTGAPAAGLDSADTLLQRDELRTLLKARRLTIAPRLTQLALSQALDYPYSIVTGWENGTRSVYVKNLREWAGALGYAPGEQDALLIRYPLGVLPDERAGLATGSRVETQINERVKALRKDRRLSMREMADVTGISTGHLQRIEQNNSNLSTAQVRQISQRLRVTYEWIIDGKGGASQLGLQQEIDRLRRDNEVLESFRRQVEKNGG